MRVLLRKKKKSLKSLILKVFLKQTNKTKKEEERSNSIRKYNINIIYISIYNFFFITKIGFTKTKKQNLQRHKNI